MFDAAADEEECFAAAEESIFVCAAVEALEAERGADFDFTDPITAEILLPSSIPGSAVENDV